MGHIIAGRIDLDQYLRRLDIFERWKRRRDVPKDAAELLKLATADESGDTLPINNNLDVNRGDE